MDFIVLVCYECQPSFFIPTHAVVSAIMNQTSSASQANMSPGCTIQPELDQNNILLQK
jgi:hypothetical protein